MESGGRSSSPCAGLSLSRPLLLRSTGYRRAGSAVVAHGPSRSVACGIFPDQGSNPCPLHWQADSQPLRHQGSPRHFDDGHSDRCGVIVVLICISLGCVYFKYTFESLTMRRVRGTPPPHRRKSRHNLEVAFHVSGRTSSSAVLYLGI